MDINLLGNKNRIDYKDFSKAQWIDSVELSWQTKKSEGTVEFLVWLQELSCQLGVTHWVFETNDDFYYTQTEIFQVIYDNGDFAIGELNGCNK